MKTKKYVNYNISAGRQRRIKITILFTDLWTGLCTAVRQASAPRTSKTADSGTANSWWCGTGDRDDRDRKDFRGFGDRNGGDELEKKPFVRKKIDDRELRSLICIFYLFCYLMFCDRYNNNNYYKDLFVDNENVE